MPKLKIDTRKSDYSPIIVEISEKEFTVREMNKEAVRELNKFDEVVTSGDMIAPYTRLAWLLDLKEDDPIFDDLHPKYVNKLTNLIIRAIYSADEAEMKGLTPGEKKKKSSGAKDRKQ